LDGKPFHLAIQVLHLEDGVGQPDGRRRIEPVLEDRFGGEEEPRAAEFDEGILGLAVRHDQPLMREEPPAQRNKVGGFRGYVGHLHADVPEFCVHGMFPAGSFGALVSQCRMAVCRRRP
jgi:hypothetical protein